MCGRAASLLRRRFDIRRTMLFRQHVWPEAVRLGACLLLLFVLMYSGQAAAADPAPEVSSQEESLARLWLSRSSDVASLMDEAAALRRQAEDMAQPLAAKVQSARTQFTRLSSLFQASRGHPTEQLTLVQQMHNLRDELQQNIAPLQNISDTIKQRLDEIASLQKDLQDISTESAKDGVNLQADPSAEAQGLKTYSKTLNQARQKLAPAAVRLENLLAPAKSSLDRFNKTIADIESGLVDVWEQYYITPSDNTLDALASTPVLLADWMASFSSRLSFANPQSFGEWMDVARSFAASAFIMAVLGLLGLQGAKSLPERWRRACERVIRRAWVWVGIGLSTLTASTNQSGGIYFAFVLLGALIIIAGVASMSWRLRIAVLPSLEEQPSPLGRLYPPAAIGVLMLFSDLPMRILGIMWGVIMIAFLVMIFSMNRKNKIETPLPLLERLSYGCAFWFGLGSLLVDVAGYARLAILIFMFLFAVVNTVTLASALMALFEMLTDRVFSKATQPVHNAVTQAVSIPVAWALSMLCTVPWIWAVPGAHYLLLHAMYANYTVGEASFDFSKILGILLLFFLFRSFISLGKASLDHLPDRVPNIEKGVLPPLRTLLIYGLWSLFGIIALGMLGVNFTSLAVVAGGLSVGIGFGMQNFFNNLISGLMLIFGRNILVGDYVDVAGASGTVKAINIRSTTIETPERALVYVPNSAIMAGQFTNWTRSSRMVRRSLNIGVAYGSDTDLVAKLLLDAAKEQEHVLAFPSPAVIFNNFGESSLDFTLNVFIDNFDHALSTMSSLRFAVEKSFSKNGVDIPFPQLTLHMPGGVATVTGDLLEKPAERQGKTEEPSPA